jgi:hypothetical protein
VHELHASGKAFDVYQLFADLFGDIGQFWSRRDNTDSLRINGKLKP